MFGRLFGSKPTRDDLQFFLECYRKALRDDNAAKYFAGYDAWHRDWTEYTKVIRVMDWLKAQAK